MSGTTFQIALPITFELTLDADTTKEAMAQLEQMLRNNEILGATDTARKTRTTASGKALTTHGR